MPKSKNPRWICLKCGLITRRKNRVLEWDHPASWFECPPEVASEIRRGHWSCPDCGTRLRNLASVLHERKEALEGKRRLGALLNCRAGKLLKKGKAFVVVACDEPYYNHVYEIIRRFERQKERWTDGDEVAFLEAMSGSTEEQQDYAEGWVRRDLFTADLAAALLAMADAIEAEGLDRDNHQECFRKAAQIVKEQGQL